MNTTCQHDAQITCAECLIREWSGHAQGDGPVITTVAELAQLLEAYANGHLVAAGERLNDYVSQRIDAQQRELSP